MAFVRLDCSTSPHVRSRPSQGKLVRVVAGEIFEVAVDLRPGSATFGR